MIERLDLQIVLYRGDTIKGEDGLTKGSERNVLVNGRMYHFMADLSPPVLGKEGTEYRSIEPDGRYVANQNKLFGVPNPRSTFQADSKGNLALILNPYSIGLINEVIFLLDHLKLSALEVTVKDTFLELLNPQDTQERKGEIEKIKTPFDHFAYTKFLQFSFKGQSSP